MNIENVNGILTQHNDKSKLTLRLKLTDEQKELFLLENGEQPKDMITVMVE